MPRRRQNRSSPIRRVGQGRYEVHLDPGMRQLIGEMAEQLRGLLRTDSAVLARLFPPPYGDDEERNEGYAVLAGSELVEHRLEALEVVEASIDADELDGAQLEAWMRSLNDIRLVLGTVLEIDDDGDAPSRRADEPMLGVYELLGSLLEMIVAALGDDLGDGDGEPHG